MSQWWTCTKQCQKHRMGVGLTRSISQLPVAVLIPDSNAYGANMGPTWVLSAPGGPHDGPINLAIRDVVQYKYSQNTGYPLNITLIVHRCYRSLAAVTPIKYEYEPQDLHYTSSKSISSRIKSPSPQTSGFYFEEIASKLVTVLKKVDCGWTFGIRWFNKSNYNHVFWLAASAANHYTTRWVRRPAIYTATQS